MPDETTAQATPTAEPGVSFREQALQRLQTESEPTDRPPADPAVESEVVQDDGPYPGDPDESRESELTEPPEELEEDETEPTDPDGEGDDTDGDVNWQQRFEDAQAELKRTQANRHEIEEGFRTRTEALITATHKLEDDLKGVEHAAEFYANLAEQAVRQFDNVDWADLQTRPEEYQAMRQRFQMATHNAQQTAAARQAVDERHREMREQVKNREAELSREMLKSLVPGWGNELYGQIRDHAVASHGFTAEEVNDITDWRLIRLLHSDMERETAKKAVTAVKRKQQAKPSGGRNAPQPKHRNARGQFQSARQKAFDSPGDRGAIRDSFRAKLRAEREGR